MIAQRDGEECLRSLPIEYTEYKLCEGRPSEYEALQRMPSSAVLRWFKFQEIEDNILHKPERERQRELKKKNGSNPKTNNRNRH